MYIIRKAIEYFFPVIPEDLYSEAMELLNEKEKNIYGNGKI